MIKVKVEKQNISILGHADYAEYGEDTGAAVVKVDGAVLEGGNHVVLADQIAEGAVVAQKLQSLEVCHGVIQTGAVQTAVEVKFPIAQLQTLPDCQHGIGVIFFHGEDGGSFRCVTKRVKVTQNAVGRDAQSVGVVQTAVSGNDKIVFGKGRGKTVEIRCAENTAFSHIAPPFLFFSVSQRGEKQKTPG